MLLWALNLLVKEEASVCSLVTQKQEEEEAAVLLNVALALG
jgi:hypothetical protein